MRSAKEAGHGNSCLFRQRKYSVPKREDLSAEARPKYRDALAAVIASPENTLFMMEEDGRLIGCLQLTMIPGLSHQGLTRALIESVRIAADRRGKGLERSVFSLRHILRV